MADTLYLDNLNVGVVWYRKLENPLLVLEEVEVLALSVLQVDLFGELSLHFVGASLGAVDALGKKYVVPMMISVA